MIAEGNAVYKKSPAVLLRLLYHWVLVVLMYHTNTHLRDWLYTQGRRLDEIFSTAAPLHQYLVIQTVAKCCKT